MQLLVGMGFFESVLHFFTTVWNVISSFLEDLVYTVGAIGTAISNVPGYLSWIPPSVYTIFASGMTIIVVYKILGRD